MRHGVMLDDGPTAPALVELLHQAPPEAEAGQKRAEDQRKHRAGLEAAPVSGPAGGKPLAPAGRARLARRSTWLKITSAKAGSASCGAWYRCSVTRPSG